MAVTAKKILQFIYDIIPFKKQIFIIIKKIVIPPRRISYYLRFRGVFQVHIDKEHSFLIKNNGFGLEAEFFWNEFSGWEETSMNLWIKLVKKADVVVDIGANLGIYSLVAQCLNPKSEVYAFEPFTDNYNKLLSNVMINNYTIRCLKKACSNNDGTAKIYYNIKEKQLTDKASLSKNFIPNASFIEIETITLKNFIENNNISNIDLIKIDVETHEPEVLEGLAVYVERFRPTMLIEILNNDVGNKVEGYLKDKNYLYFSICEERKRVRLVDHIQKNDSFNYLICSEKVARDIKVIE